MNRIKNTMRCMAILLSLASCHDESMPIIYPGKTVLVYMAANNSLSGNTGANIDSLVSGMSGFEGKGNLLIYLAGSEGVPQLIQLVKNKNGTVTKKIIKTYPLQNSVSSTVMSNVFFDMTSRFPSQSYGLVLWSHGYGWFPGAVNAKAASALAWFGQDGVYYMDVPDLVSALNTGPHFSFILFDACFMSGVETAYALRNTTDYLIATPTEVLSEGFPYSELIPSLFGSSESDYIRIASLFYDHYNKMSGLNRSASVGCIKTCEMENLSVETAKLISAHATELNTFKASIVQNLEIYSPHLFYDFGHFIETFTTAEERVNFENQLNKTVVYKACTPNIVSIRSNGYYEFFPVSHFCGLNTYIPQTGNVTNNSAYHSFEWFTASGWSKTSW